jgi:hypothetical protein
MQLVNVIPFNPILYLIIFGACIVGLIILFLFYKEIKEENK